MKNTVLLFCLLISFQSLCQSNSDIWMMQIDVSAGSVLFSNPRNITGKKGYENQPCYSQDGKAIYYTDRSDTSVKTTIYSYTLSTGQTSQVTFSSLSPYSPRPLPGGNGISVLMVEADSTQRIWQYSFSGAGAYPLFPKRDSIGYYEWIDTGTVLAYILAGKNPLPRISVIAGDGTEKKIAENVGRGMRTVGKGAFFIQRKDTVNYIAWTDYVTTKQLVKTPGRSMDLTIYKDYVLMASRGIMYGAKMEMENGRVTGLQEFKELQNLNSIGLKNITRMAVSPDEKTIAVVTGM
jgi:hypothetical protein